MNTTKRTNEMKHKQIRSNSYVYLTFIYIFIQQVLLLLK